MFKRQLIIRRLGGPHMSRAVPASAIPYLTFGHMVYTPFGVNRLNTLWGKSSIPPLGHIESPSQWVLGAFSAGVKWQGRKAEQTAPHSVQVKNAWNYTCAATYIRVLVFNPLYPTGHYMYHHQFNIQQLYALPAPYLYVLYLSENKQRLVSLTA